MGNKTKRQSRAVLTRAIIRRPFRDELGRKHWFERIARAQSHVIRSIQVKIDGWPCWSRPLRIVLLADFHTGSHSGDVARLEGIISEARTFDPDLVLFGGDFVNMQLFGGGRVPPQVIAAILAQLNGHLGQFAVLGNHDYTYGAEEVTDALRKHGVTVLDNEGRVVNFEGAPIGIVGIPDANVQRARSKQLLAGLLPNSQPLCLLMIRCGSRTYQPDLT